MTVPSFILLSVSLATANVLSYYMLILVGIFLVFGPAITWYFWKQSKKLKTAPSAQAPQ